MTETADAAPTPPIDPAALCECNSGLSAGYCCAYDPKIAPPEPEDAELDATVESASAALRAGDPEQAARLAVAALSRAPQRAHALATLAEVRLGQRRPRAAKALLERLMEIDPGNFWPVNKLGLLELSCGNADAAEPLARRGIRSTPRRTISWA